MAHTILNLFFLGGGSITVACYWGSRSSPLRCTVALAWRTPPTLVSKALICSSRVLHVSVTNDRLE
ncbi:hypothetical protein NC653_013537 [Populus alba x Populus x berolinensis]|uniref:Uncharacterized protein n=1 Tax=Populus alba x Populus x berolinensis TaxID=444605 RepID=A0AAD6W3N6_9ROSI|nr:hypothetical protein NC653_013537 [Populus alba x Populus x berolinensis]